MWTKATVLGGVAALALVAGGAGMAIAHAQGTAAPTVVTADPTPSPSPSAKAGKTGKAGQAGQDGRPAARQILGKLKDFQHAEWVTKGDGNAYVTHEAILGQVQTVSATSITVKSTDGTSLSFAVNDQTKIRQRAEAASTTPTIADVKQGQTVLVVGAKSPDLTAKNILLRAS